MKHIHVYRILEKAEIHINADVTYEQAVTIALDKAKTGKLKFSDKDLDEEFPDRLLALWYTHE